jgi:uncharacterized protein (TIGR03790 family)
MKSCKGLVRFLVLLLGVFLLFPAWIAALEPAEVVVIANRQVVDSIVLAKYYMERRGIPAGNLITVGTTRNESVSREDYERDIRRPVLYALARLPRPGDVRCLVLMFGMPLRVMPPVLSAGDRATVRQLERQLQDLQARLVGPESPTEEERVRAAMETVSRRLEGLKQDNARAAVDSEIALVLSGDYPLPGWLPNPHFLGFQEQETLLGSKRVLMVSRLDGPEPETVRRIIDSSISTEQTGLTGKAYFDARGPGSPKKELSGYALYDNAIHHAAQLVGLSGRMEVKLDSRPELYQENDCPGAALYCGWYSLAKYVDAFEWMPGAVGYHIASSECATLKRAGSQVWC